MSKLIWTCGVTTVPQRRFDTLPKTLESLRQAGFPDPRLFVEGCEPDLSWRGLDLPLTFRHTKLQSPIAGPTGNWILAMWELLIRNPTADRFALFQDDVSFCRNLRPYLDRCAFPKQGYWNLYTVPFTETLYRDKPDGWYEAPLLGGFLPSSHTDPTAKKMQQGRGALGLVFSRDGLGALFGSDFLARKVQTPTGYRAVDGAIVNAMNNTGWLEYVHLPSLCQHAGEVSTMAKPAAAKSRSFRGEGWDAMELLTAKTGIDVLN